MTMCMKEKKLDTVSSIWSIFLLMVPMVFAVLKSIVLFMGVTSYNKIVVFIDRSPAECYNSFRVLWIGEALLPQRRFLGGSNHSFFVEMLIS